MPTATPVLTDLLDAIVNRLGDIAKELRGNLSDPALAEVRNAARAAERAYVLMSPWGPHVEDIDHEDILAAIEWHIVRSDGIPMPPDEHFANATIEATDLEGSDDYVRVTMPGCVYLVIGEPDAWSVVGRYPQ